MNNIFYRRKWNDTDLRWEAPSNNTEKGRCFALAEFSDIINNKKDKSINYIIVANGGRVEDRSKDNETVESTELHLDFLLENLKNKPNNYRIIMFMMDADAPIIEDSKLMADLFDDWAADKSVKSINYFGLSKCGAMGFYIPRFFKNQITYNKSNLFLIAVPYIGTKLASPKIIYEEIRKVCRRFLIGEKTIERIIAKYESISSNSHMDYDISVPNGIPENKLKYYDANFIGNMFSEENILTMKKVNSFYNIVTYIDEVVLKETKNRRGKLLCLTNKLLFDSKSDGMVYTSTQEEVYKHIQPTGSLKINTHHDFFSNERAMTKLIELTDKTITKMK